MAELWDIYDINRNPDGEATDAKWVTIDDIIEKDKVLLIQQTKGHWGFPKGHVEVGETEIETAIREVKEETLKIQSFFFA